MGYVSQLVEIFPISEYDFLSNNNLFSFFLLDQGRGRDQYQGHDPLQVIQGGTAVIATEVANQGHQK